MKKSELKRELKRSGRLYLAEVDGVTWATNSYWAAPAASVDGLRDLLADVNLTLEPGCYEVNGSIRCHCPDDCNCRVPWRTNYCGCHNHAEDYLHQHVKVIHVQMPAPKGAQS